MRTVFYSADSNALCVAILLEGIFKEAVVTYFKVLSCYMTGGAVNHHNLRIVGVPDDIRSWPLFPPLQIILAWLVLLHCRWCVTSPTAVTATGSVKEYFDVFWASGISRRLMSRCMIQLCSCGGGTEFLVEKRQWNAEGRVHKKHESWI
jgi:hypothetical protein